MEDFEGERLKDLTTFLRESSLTRRITRAGRSQCKRWMNWRGCSASCRPVQRS